MEADSEGHDKRKVITLFSFEEGSGEIIDRAIEKYEKSFNMEFPLYEYIEITRNQEYDFSLDGAKKLTEFINEKIDNGMPVPIPSDYFNRNY